MPNDEELSLHSFISNWLLSVSNDSTNSMSRFDSDGFVIVPSRPSSRSSHLPSRSGHPDSVSSSHTSRRLIADFHYRRLNLAANHVFLRNSKYQLPDSVSTLVGEIKQDRDCPVLSPQRIERLEQIEMDVEEIEVQEFFLQTVFADRPGTNLKRTIGMPMVKKSVPNTSIQYRISTPTPDILFGYEESSFKSMASQMLLLGRDPVANTPGTTFPFLNVEFKGDGPSGGGTFWECTNQCLGGSACCINILQQLNKQAKIPVDATTFSIAMTGTEARVFVSWKEGVDYNTIKVKSFLLSEPDGFIGFQKVVLNIIDWGLGKRLRDIQTSLGSVGGKETHPLSDAESPGGKRRKTTPQSKTSTTLKSTGATSNKSKSATP